MTGELRKEILRWIDDHNRKIIEFCKEFMKYKSVTGKETQVQQDFILKMLNDSGSWDIVETISGRKQKRPNIVAILKGSRRDRNLLFNGHVDVVDVQETQLSSWKSDPWKPEVRDEKIYGRGANDMKGGLTCAVWAVKALTNLGVKLSGNLAMEFVVGEELMQHKIGTTLATKNLLRKGYRFQFCVDPEPTNCEIHTLSAGTFDFEIIVQGKEIHTAMRNLILHPQRWGIPCGDELGVDAIAKMMDILAVLRKMEKQWAFDWRHPVIGSGGYPQHEDLQGIGCYTINPSFVDGGTYIASIPGRARAHCQCYYPPWVGYEQVASQIRRAIEAHSSTDSWLSKHPPKLVFGKSFVWPPYQTNIDHPGCRTLASSWMEATGKPAQFSGFKAVNDLAFLYQLGILGVAMGPGDLSMGAHGPNEYVPIDQMIMCTKTFALFILDYCGIDSKT